MHRFWNSSARPKVSLLTLALLIMVGALALAGCGGSSRGAGSGASARSLLTDTFTGRHDINSGRLSASISVDPTGSRVITGPVSLSFSGPFQSRGGNQLPESDFTIAIGFEGHTGQLGILSTGTRGFVTLEGSAYALPAASFKQLEGGVSAVGGSSGTGSALSDLGIHPQRWLTDPEVVGTARMGGADTDHIRGTLAIRPLLADLSKLLSKASTVSSSASALKPLSAAEQAKIAGEVTHASFDLWTGTQDHTIRKLAVTATLPVNGSLRTELGGMTSAKLSFGLSYSGIGQPETITAPSSSKPYSQFQSRLSAIVLEIEDLVVSATGSGTSTTSSPSASSSSQAATAYSQCVSAAGSSVSKIQKCAALLNGTSGG